MELNNLSSNNIEPLRIGIQNSEPMNEDQMEKIHRNLIMAITEQFTDGGGPELLSFTHKPGWILVTCVDQLSLDWLVEVVQYLEPWPGALLSIIPEHELPNLPRVDALIPESEADSTEEALDLFNAQNIGLNKSKRQSTDKPRSEQPPAKRQNPGKAVADGPRKDAKTREALDHLRAKNNGLNKSKRQSTDKPSSEQPPAKRQNPGKVDEGPQNGAKTQEALEHLKAKNNGLNKSKRQSTDKPRSEQPPAKRQNPGKVDEGPRNVAKTQEALDDLKAKNNGLNKSKRQSTDKPSSEQPPAKRQNPGKVDEGPQNGAKTQEALEHLKAKNNGLDKSKRQCTDKPRSEQPPAKRQNPGKVDEGPRNVAKTQEALDHLKAKKNCLNKSKGQSTDKPRSEQPPAKRQNPGKAVTEGPRNAAKANRGLAVAVCREDDKSVDEALAKLIRKKLTQLIEVVVLRIVKGESGLVAPSFATSGLVSEGFFLVTPNTTESRDWLLSQDFGALDGHKLTVRKLEETRVQVWIPGETGTEYVKEFLYGQNTELPELKILEWKAVGRESLKLGTRLTYVVPEDVEKTWGEERTKRLHFSGTMVKVRILRANTNPQPSIPHLSRG